MKTQSHTSPPWHAIKGDVLNPDRTFGVVKYLTLEQCQEIDGDEATYPSRTEVIAEVCVGPTDEADAYVLAAAPDYDEAARLAVESAYDLPNGGVAITHEAFVALQGAIAKAENR